MRTVSVRVEVPRGGLLRFSDEGRIRAWTPIPLPFAYGHVPNTFAADGAPLDAVVLGASARRGDVVHVPVFGAVWFDDDGRIDDKLVCGRKPGVMTRSALLTWFRAYAAVRRLLGTQTRVVGWGDAERGSPTGPV